MAGKKGMKHFGESIIDEVLRLRSEGKTIKEITEIYGFDNPEIIKSLLKRYRKKCRAMDAGFIPRKRGRPRNYELLDKDQQIKQLKMENDLLRSFLSAVGRR